MIRLQATNAVAMPEINYIYLPPRRCYTFVSYTLPGIKIDCVPGYSSQVAIFLTHGIFEVMYGDLWTISSLNANSSIFYEKDLFCDVPTLCITQTLTRFLT